MSRLRRGLTVALLALTVCTALSGAAAGFVADDALADSTETPTPTDSTSLTGTVNDTLDDATDATLGTETATPTATLDDTTDAVDDTTDSTLDDTSDAVDDTTDAVDDTTDSTLDDTTDAVDDTTDSTLDDTSDAVDDTTDAVDDTTDAVDDTTDSTLDDTTGLLDDATIVDGTDGTFTVSSTTAGDLESSTTDGAATTSSAGSEESPSLAAAMTAETGTTDAATAGTPLPAGPGATAAGATALAGLSAVAAGSMLGGGTGVERAVSGRVTGALERLVRMVAPFRYSRYDGSDPLEHEDRAAIHEYVTEQPGAYASAVSEQVGVNHSTARHHVKILEREGFVESAKVRGRRRLFPAHAQQQELAAAMTDEATADVLSAIARLGPCSGSALAEEVDRSVSTVSHHLSRLADDGLVDREKDGRTTVNSLPSDVQEALAPEREPAAVDAPTVSAD